MKNSFQILIIFLILVLLPSAAFATKFISFGGSGFHADTVYDDDIFIKGQKIKMDSRINGDLFAFCQEIVLTDSISGSFNSFSESVQVLGPVANSFRGFGYKVTCNAPIGRNVLIKTLFPGNNVTIGPQAIIGKNGDIFCAKLVFKGDVKGNLRIKSDNTVISGRIGGDLEFEGGTLTIGSDAVIDGDVIYKSSSKAEINKSALIKGEINWEELEADADDDESWLSFLKFIAWFFSFRGYLLLVMMVSLSTLIFSVIPFPTWGLILFYSIIMLVSGNILLMLTKEKAKETLSLLDARFFPSLGLGFIIFFVAPLISMVIIFTFVGAPLGIAILLVFGVAAFAGSVYACAFFGRMIWGFLGGKTESYPGYWHYSFGVLLIILLSYIPVFGYLLITMVFMTGLGGFAQSFKLK